MARLTARQALTELRGRVPQRPRIYAPGCSGEALRFAQEMASAPELAAGATFLGVWIPGVNTTDYAALSADAASELIFLAPEFRQSFESRRARLFPLSYVQAWRRLRETPLDAALVQTSSPDKDGMVSLGVSADFSPAVLERANIVKVAHVNAEMPRPPMSPSYPLSLFDIVVDEPSPLLRYESGDLAPAFSEIGRLVASLIEDGDTLQFGLGNVQFAVLKALAPRRRLRIHSGMISEPIIEAIDAGSISDAAGSITAGVALGGPALYAIAARDPRFRFEPVGFTHAISTLAGIENFVAINSVIEVDLFGQANAEYVGGKQISGAGGIVDFLRGAAAARGGLPIVALASSARGGAISRITPRLQSPTATVARADIGIVVTEYGVADLRGRSLDERAQALIQIAHPVHRASLKTAWDAAAKEL